MTCCNNNCNQGRNCPKRTAKVGKRYPSTTQYVTRSRWRDRLEPVTIWGLVCLASLLVFTVIVGVAK